MEKELKLKEGEKVILKNGEITVPIPGILLLTNKRLILYQRQGFFKPSYVKKKEIPLEQIVEVYSDIGSFTGLCTMKLTLDQGEWECIFGVPDTAFLFGTMSVKQRAITERWVNDLNRFI